MGPLYQDLYGSAGFANGADEPDLTLPAIPEETKRVDAEVTPSADSLGLSILQKASFFGIILGAVAIFLRSRRGLAAGGKA